MAAEQRSTRLERYDRAVGRAVQARRWHEAAKGDAKRAKAELEDALRALLAVREAGDDAGFTQLSFDAQGARDSDGG